MGRTMHGTRNFARDTDGYVRKDKIRTFDRQEQIDACLSCTEPRCSGDRCRHLTGRGQATPARTDTRRPFGRDARHYVYEGKAYTAGELAAIAGVLTKTLHDRIYRGWTVEEAVRGARDGKKKEGLQRAIPIQRGIQDRKGAGGDRGHDAGRDALAAA